jgi:hypothetical protein
VCDWLFPMDCDAQVAEALAKSLIKTLHISWLSHDSECSLVFGTTLSRCLQSSNIQSLHLKIGNVRQVFHDAIIAILQSAEQWRLNTFVLTLHARNWGSMIEQALSGYIAHTFYLKKLQISCWTGSYARRYSHSLPLLVAAGAVGTGCLDSLDFTGSNAFDQDWVAQVIRAVHCNYERQKRIQAPVFGEVSAAPSSRQRWTGFISAFGAIDDPATQFAFFEITIATLVTSYSMRCECKCFCARSRGKTKLLQMANRRVTSVRSRTHWIQATNIVMMDETLFVTANVFCCTKIT